MITKNKNKIYMLVSESIWDNGQFLIPMAEVSHVEKDQREGFKANVSVIFKHSKWNDATQSFEPMAYLQGLAASGFIRSYCIYRSELESKTIKDLQPC
jgi:hypothetical protein